MERLKVSGRRTATACPAGRVCMQNGQAQKVVRPTRHAMRAFTVERQSKETTADGFANQLEALKSMSKVVADTGEPELVKLYKPVDCTTNPSLVYKAVQDPAYQHFLSDALAITDKGVKDINRPYVNVADVMSVMIGCEMLKIVPGRVSTEVDAHLSYDKQALIDKALRLMDQYSQRGIEPERVYIKLASTWEGIQACETLQRQGIDTNMTLLFSFAQAAACADVGAALISPFVGRIMDWYKAKEGRSFAPEEDPGVKSVQRIYKYYKDYGYKTIVMAASFRNAGEIRELAGCDNITIAPALLKELENSKDPLPRKLWPDMEGEKDRQYSNIKESEFFELHNADQMAVDKLLQGIEGFKADQVKLEDQMAKLASEM